MTPSNRKPPSFTVPVASVALSGGVVPNQIADLAAFKRKVKLVFVCYGSRDNGAAGKANMAALKKAGVDSVYYESPNTPHEWHAWRRSLREFAPFAVPRSVKPFAGKIC